MERRQSDSIDAAEMTGQGVSRALYTGYKPLRVKLPLVRENFPCLLLLMAVVLFLLFVLFCFVCFCCCYVATRSLVTFLSSVLAEGALECDHNL